MNSTTPNAQPLLTVDNLSIRLPAGLDRSHAVQNINFTLHAGEVLCMIGESGSGKSVTSNAIMGLLPKSIKVETGSIKLNGKEILNQSEAQSRAMRGRIVSMVFQDPLSSLNPLMTIGAQIKEVFDSHNVLSASERQERVVQLLTDVGIPNPVLAQHQYPFRLSGGQRQRVMIAMALALDPEVLIADEPTTALDVTTQAQILQLIRDLQKRKNMGVIFVTHDVGVVAEMATKVIVLEKGVQVESGEPDAILNNPQHPYTQRLIAAVPKLTLNVIAAPLSDKPILEVKNLNKEYQLAASSFFAKKRTLKAVSDVSFNLFAGETLGIVGESGSGKSTVARLVMKLLEANSGQILLNGTDIQPMKESDFRPLRAKIQMVFQDPQASLNPRHTIGTSMIVGPMAHGVPKDVAVNKARALLDRVSLQASAFDRYPHEFSGGQRQRVGIARALMFDPQIIVADEAVSALDVSIQAQILELLEDVKKEQQLSMIFITHDLLVASQICDKIMVLRHGQLVEIGAPAEVFLRPKADYTRELVTAIPGIKQHMPVVVD
jgi:peptide/nickel transport system ATP-binding protein